MEPLLNKHTIPLMRRVLDCQEECPLAGEYVLPEYCRDVAVILKCFAVPRMQNRQWSGEQLLIDGSSVIRVLYLDEDREQVHSLEFLLPFSCTVRGGAGMDDAALIQLSTKYVNCRAVGPRRIEVRGAVTVSVCAECAVPHEIAIPMDCDRFYTRMDTMEVTVPSGMVEKVLAINDSLEFNQTLPPAEMLLGGECNAVIKECKLLPGKAIIKGFIYIHQLYSDTMDGQHTHCLNYVVPYSQILDVSDASEGVPYKASVQVLSDTERCSVGPDGENTILDISVKLLLTLQVYKRERLSLLTDAFHSQVPLLAHTEAMEICSFEGQRFEETKLTLRIHADTNDWQEIIDVWASSIEERCAVDSGIATLTGRLQVCVLVRDTNGEVFYREFVEDYSTRLTCGGNRGETKLIVTDLQYRIHNDALELTCSLNTNIATYRCDEKEVVTDLKAQDSHPYPNRSHTALLYYGECGESVWDIARSCRTSPAEIMRENHLQSDSLVEQSVLIVPIC